MMNVVHLLLYFAAVCVPQGEQSSTTNKPGCCLVPSSALLAQP
jgi:hypothetical protein